MSAPYPRPDPVDADAAHFWAGIAAGELRIQQCVACGTFRHPPQPLCAHCGEGHSAWRAVAGTGEIWSFTVIHPPTLPAFADRVPYGAVVVRLDEGVFMVSNLVDCPTEELQVGARVELALTRVEDDLVLPLFRRATGP